MTGSRLLVAVAVSLLVSSCGASDGPRTHDASAGEVVDGMEPVEQPPGPEPSRASGQPGTSVGANSARNPDGQPEIAPARRPPEGEFRYRDVEGKERTYVFGQSSSVDQGWLVPVDAAGKTQEQMWTSEGVALVSEEWGDAACQFDPPLLVRSALRKGSAWEADSSCRLGESDSYMSRSVRAEVLETTTVTAMGSPRPAWRVKEFIRTIVEARSPAGMSVVTSQRYQSVEELTQTTEFSEELGVPLAVAGQRRFTNSDGSVHEGNFRYDLIAVP